MTRDDLKAWRERHQISQRQAAEALGCSKSSIVKWERSGGIPRYIALACAAYANGLAPMGNPQ